MSLRVQVLRLLQLCSFIFFLYPKGLVYLYFLIPVPGALMVIIFFFLETIHCSFSCSSQNFFVSSHFRVQLWLLVIYFGWRYVLLLCILLFLIFYIVIEWLGITLFPFFNCPWVLTNVTFLFVFVNIACACFRCLFVSCIYVCRSGDLQGQGCQFNSRWLIHSHRGRCRYHVLWPRDIVLVEGWGRAGLKGRDGGLEGGWIVLSKT
jgi:hypothetical protein